MKTCIKCGETKEETCFPEGRHRCKTCAAAHTRQYNSRHHDQNAARRRRYYSEYRKEAAAYNHQYRSGHREAMAVYDHQYRSGHRSLRYACEARRRARKQQAAGYNYTTAEMTAARWEMWGNRCWICGKEAQATDHVKPLSKGGAHWPCNLRPICNKCNSGKKNKWPYPMGPLAT